MAGNPVCVLMSGGLDSCVLDAVASSRAEIVHPVYVRTGLLWETAELHWLHLYFSALASPRIQAVKILNLPVGDVYRRHWSLTGEAIPDHCSTDEEVYLPGRNLLLLSKTALFCALNQIPWLAIGTLKGNPFSDATQDFFDRYAEVASHGLNFRLRVQSPFAALSKVQVIQLGRGLPLHLSFSCIHPAGLAHCGSCNKCAERRRSFETAGIVDQTEYHSLPVLTKHS